MRDIETIDGELRLVARAWRVTHHLGYKPSTVLVDELLDEPLQGFRGCPALARWTS
jgi:hypothetical protein